MQTERVTFLTSPDHKAALDAFAASNGKSVGHVLREASTRYLATEDRADGEDEKAFALILPEIEAMLPQWHAKIDSMEQSIDRALEAIDRALAGDPVPMSHAA
ncbi:hypothetical protein [Sphingomonas sp. LR55]|uniref:hypothetical protein n=1 Tax=Sphingomonas sp. LR55 TaxID=3050231 RepID=UPI002FE241A9